MKFTTHPHKIKFEIYYLPTINLDLYYVPTKNSKSTTTSQIYKGTRSTEGGVFFFFFKFTCRSGIDDRVLVVKNVGGLISYGVGGGEPLLLPLTSFMILEPVEDIFTLNLAVLSKPS